MDLLLKGPQNAHFSSYISCCLSDCFSVSRLVLEIYAVEISEYNGSEWCSKCGAHSHKKYI